VAGPANYPAAVRKVRRFAAPAAILAIAAAAPAPAAHNTPL
jgi:hypothetical protein